MKPNEYNIFFEMCKAMIGKLDDDNVTEDELWQRYHFYKDLIADLSQYTLVFPQRIYEGRQALEKAHIMGYTNLGEIAPNIYQYFDIYNRTILVHVGKTARIWHGQLEPWRTSLSYYYNRIEDRPDIRQIVKCVPSYEWVDDFLDFIKGTALEESYGNSTKLKVPRGKVC